MIFPNWIGSIGSGPTTEVAVSVDTIVITSDNIANQDDTIGGMALQTAPSLVGIPTSMTTILPTQQYDTYVVNDEQNVLLPYDKMGGFSYPKEIVSPCSLVEPKTMTSGVVILPTQGAGRGPVINEGQVIDTALLQELLSGILQEEHLSSDLLETLTAYDDTRDNSKEQSGYGTHNDVITLDHSWTASWPKIDFTIAPGALIQFRETIIGTAPNDIAYTEIPDQEAIYGYSGIIDSNEFTIKAAVLEKEDPIVIDINWEPSDITGPPLLVQTTESTTYNTTNDCMAIKIKGTLGLTNALSYKVKGSMYAEVSVDGGSWVKVSELSWSFPEDNPDIVTSSFDAMIVHEQGAHTYQFRGSLVTTSDDEPNRELTGSIQIDTVEELGSGTIISNDLQVKWASKE